jgi:hypothetical protein
MTVSIDRAVSANVAVARPTAPAPVTGTDQHRRPPWSVRNNAFGPL